MSEDQTCQKTGRHCTVPSLQQAYITLDTEGPSAVVGPRHSRNDKEGGGRSGERGEQRTETARRPDNREGDLDEQAAAADNEDKRAGQGGGWANIAVVLSPPWLEIC